MRGLLLIAGAAVVFLGKDLAAAYDRARRSAAVGGSLSGTLEKAGLTGGGGGGSGGGSTYEDILAKVEQGVAVAGKAVDVVDSGRKLLKELGIG